MTWAWARRSRPSRSSATPGRRHRRRGAEPPRFLVVAPTSVVHTWEGEAARFAPGLTVAAVTETRARRRVPIADLAASADVLVTSYTLLRIEHHEYTALDWDGVVLDEAQTVKNRRTSTYARVASLRAPFRLAISGTPVENDLMSCGGALARGAGRARHGGPVPRAVRDPDREGRHGPSLERLRRRIRPLVLRRTKGEVATDLPDKQEQVLALDLLPAHRTAYDGCSSASAQKVLGLIQDEEHFESNRFVVIPLAHPPAPGGPVAAARRGRRAGPSAKARGARRARRRRRRGGAPRARVQPVHALPRRCARTAGAGRRGVRLLDGSTTGGRRSSRASGRARRPCSSSASRPAAPG